MSEWICTECGTTMSSKCPGQRSVFLSDDRLVLVNNALTVDLIKGLNRTEVFTSYTAWAGNPFEKFQAFITEFGADLVKANCSHHWILSSKTRKTCQMGCEHDNLTTYVKPEATEPALPTMESVINQAYHAARNVMLVAKPILWDFMPERDTRVRFNYDLDRLIQRFGRSLDKLKEEKSILGTYRVSAYSYHNEEGLNEYFSTDDQGLAEKVFFAMQELHPGKVRMSMAGINDSDIYLEPVQPRPICGLCNQETKEMDNLRFVEGKLIHADCHDELLDRPVIKDRSFLWVTKNPPNFSWCAEQEDYDSLYRCIQREVFLYKDQFNLVSARGSRELKNGTFKLKLVIHGNAEEVESCLTFLNNR